MWTDTSGNEQPSVIHHMFCNAAFPPCFLASKLFPKYCSCQIIWSPNLSGTLLFYFISNLSSTLSNLNRNVGMLPVGFTSTLSNLKMIIDMMPVVFTMVFYFALRITYWIVIVSDIFFRGLSFYCLIVVVQSHARITKFLSLMPELSAHFVIS